MKSTNNYFYWDYNATSPLAQSVKDWVSTGDLHFANPSSIHSLGIKSKQQILETEEYLLDFFGLKKTHHLFFHSGASESINTILRSAMENDLASYYCFQSDHSTSFNIGEYFAEEGRDVVFYQPLKNGDLPLEKLISSIADKPTVLNFTWVNSESGICWPLDFVTELKSKCTKTFIHVDGVQAIGKVHGFNKLNPEVDAYTFSGHKFGALKGVGFSFIKKTNDFRPFILGGGQQRGLRSGTENPTGIYSLKLALEEVSKNDMLKNEDAKSYFEEKMLKAFSNNIHIIGKDATFRNTTTSLIWFKDIAINIFLTALDMGKIYVSSGSACSSGQLKPSRVLLSMGHDKESAKQAIRFSFGGDIDRRQIDCGMEILSPLISRFLSK